MTRNLLISILAFLSIFNALLFYAAFKESRPQGSIQERKQKLAPILENKNKPKSIPPTIQAVNQRNSQIQNFACEDLEIKIWQDGNKIKLNGKMYFEKPNNFRLEISSIFGKELDIGSNDKVFWYWSKRDREQGLHWATYENFQKTRLKAPFSPMFMRSSLGLEVIESEKAIRIAENEKDIMLVFSGASGSGNLINKSVFVNKFTNNIDAFLLTSVDGKSIAACEIQEYVNGLPSRLLYTWYDENKLLGIKFNKAKTNIAIKASTWALPNYTPKINMADRF